MELAPSLGILGVVTGLVLSAVGLIQIFNNVRVHGSSTLGVATVFIGVAIATLASSMLLLHRAGAVLPLPVSLVVMAFLLLVSLRLVLAAISARKRR